MNTFFINSVSRTIFYHIKQKEKFKQCKTETQKIKNRNKQQRVNKKNETIQKKQNNRKDNKTETKQRTKHSKTNTKTSTTTKTTTATKTRPINR